MFLMHMFSKGERVDLSQGERNELRVILTGAVEAYRRGVRDHVQGR